MMARSTTRPHLVLYSAISTLAYWIAQKYYMERHYVWCAPGPNMDRFAPRNPPSSDPVRIYWAYHDDIAAGDDHSAKITENRFGIIRGATAKHASGVIDEATRQSIADMARLAPLSDFNPLFLVIPMAEIGETARPADPRDRARPTAEEFIIDDLPRTGFDILTLHRRSMDRVSTIETLIQQLKPLPRSVAVEATYLVLHCLTYRWNREDILARVSAEARLPYQQRATDVVLEMVSTIERSEGTELSRLAGSIRLDYWRQLSDAVLASEDANQVDRSAVDAALSELRQIA